MNTQQLQGPCAIYFSRSAGKYGYLSNFYETQVVYRGLPFTSAEAAFQGMKTLNPAERVRFTNMNPGTAKKEGRKVLLRKDWEKVKFSEMLEIQKAKYSQNQQLAQQLISTGQCLILERTSWRDNTWGRDFNSRHTVGKNYLGVCLMMTRALLTNNFIVVLPNGVNIDLRQYVYSYIVDKNGAKKMSDMFDWIYDNNLYVTN